MADLAEIQRRFGAALTGDAIGDACTLVAGDETRARARLAIYQGNQRATRTRALRSAYPVLVQLVGDGYFDAMAVEYAAARPGAAGDLNGHGAELAAFLETFPPAADLPYLPDVARLEWLLHRAHYAADRAPLDAVALAAVDPALQGRLRLELNPACALLKSRWPVVRIWASHQRGYTGNPAIDLKGGPEHALVLRPGFRACARAVPPGDHRFLHGVAARESLQDALAAALAVDAAFDLGSSLRGWITDRVVTGYAVD